MPPLEDMNLEDVEKWLIKKPLPASKGTPARPRNPRPEPQRIYRRLQRYGL